MVIQPRSYLLPLVISGAPYNMDTKGRLCYACSHSPAISFAAFPPVVLKLHTRSLAPHTTRERIEAGYYTLPRAESGNAVRRLHGPLHHAAGYRACRGQYVVEGRGGVSAGGNGPSGRRGVISRMYKLKPNAVMHPTWGVLPKRERGAITAKACRLGGRMSGRSSC